MDLNLKTPVISLKGVGDNTCTYLTKMGIINLYDLVLHFPYRYLDFSKISKIDEVKIGDPVTINGVIKSVSLKKFKGKNSLLEIFVFDGSGYIAGVWFNQPFLEKKFNQNDQVTLSGIVEYKYNKLQISNPIFELGEMNGKGRIVPVHPLTGNLSSKKLQNLIKQALDLLYIEEVLPESILRKYNLIDRSKAFKDVHFPKDIESLKRARFRMKFEELFLLQSGLLSQKKTLGEGSSYAFRNKTDLIEKATKNLGYDLTEDQKKSFDEIKTDLLNKEPMSRLLQGEVGSGKTTVALLSLLFTVDNGYQAVMMAPTEILAIQHFLKFKELLKGVSLNIELLTGSLSENEKIEVKGRITNGNADIVIGTHALIQQDVCFKRLGLAIIDEQHRFGVRQRADLKGKYANILVMTATPIPRTLALTCYSDLDISTIRELPGGKKINENIETLVVKNDKRQKAYEKIKREIEKGRQAYIICPLIEESDKVQVKAVKEESEYLKNVVFKDYKVAILHGKLKSKEKESVMDSFRKAQVDILISTTVIEVGIDVGNATVMVIENAERFGLSQLHQLRGRIGRGAYHSYCIVFANLENEDTKKRMKAFKNLSDGFKLAEADLEIRGEGQITGLRQSGYGDLRLIRLTRDIELIKTVKAAAKSFVSNGSVSDVLAEEIAYRFPNINMVFQG